MPKARLFLFVAIALLPLSGCGTVLNMTSADPEVYGGVKKDCEIAVSPHNYGSGGKNTPLVMVFWLADVGVSAVGDTVTLPFVAFREPKIPSEDRGSPSFLPQYSYGAIAATHAPSSSVEPVSLFAPELKPKSESVSGSPSTGTWQDTKEETSAVPFPLKDGPFLSPAPDLLPTAPPSPP